MKHARQEMTIAALILLVATACGTTQSKSAIERPRSWSTIQDVTNSDKDTVDPMIHTLKSESRYRFDTPGAYSVTHIHKFKILKEEALEHWGMFAIPFAPWHQEKPKIQATVTNPDGSKTILDPSTISDQSAREVSDQIISSNRKLVGPLPKLQVGSVVEITTSTKYKESVYGPAAGGWHAFGAVNRQVDLSRLIIDHPESVSIQFKDYDTNVAISSVSKEGRIIDTAEVKNIAPIPYPETNLPKEMVVVPSIAFSSGKSWESLSTAYLEKITPVLNIDSCRSDIAELIPPSGTDAEKISGLLKNLRKQVRYTGLELGENAIIPVSPCETLKRGFGDCKDQSALMVTALATMNIDAHLALVNSEYDLDVEPSLPSMYGFNHVIVYIPGKDPIWVDPSLSHARVSELGASCSNRNALIISERTDHLIKTPKQTPKSNKYHEKRTFNLSLYDKGSLIEESSFSGVFERYQRHAFEENQKKKNESFERYIEKAYRADELISVQQIDPENLQEQFGYRIVANQSKNLITDLESAVAVLVPWSLFETFPNVLNPINYDKEDLKEKRKAPLEFSHLASSEIEYVVNAPKGFEYKGDLKDFSKKIGSVTFGVTYSSSSPTTVSAKFYTSSGDGTLSAIEVDELREALLEWSGDFPPIVEFRNVSEHLMETGKFKEGLAYARKIIKSDPSVPEHHLWYAQALLFAGFGEAAQNAARAATEASPKSVHSWVVYGWTLEHNFLAQRFGKGFNRQSAIDAYQKAIDIDSNDTYALSSLAILMEYNKEGERYKNREDTEKAITHYKTILEEDDTEQIKINMLSAMVNCGRYDEVLKETEGALDDATIGTFRLASIAGTKGVDATLSESSAIFPDESQRLKALDKVIFHLTQNRKYKVAAALIRATETGAKGTDRLVRAAMLDKIELVPPHQTFNETPERPVKEFFSLLFGNPGNPIELFAPSLRKHIDESDYDLQDMVRSFKNTISKGDSKSFSTEFFRDLVFSLFEIVKKGDDKVGYKLEVKQFGFSNVSLPFFVVKEKGRYYFADTVAIGLSGILIQNMINDGQLKKAERWLDWIEETGKIKNFHEYWTPKSKGDKTSAQIAVWRLTTRFKNGAKLVAPKVEKALLSEDMKPHIEKLQHILLLAYASLDAHEKIMTISKQMIDNNQQFPKAWAFYLYAARKAKKYKNIQTLAEQLLKKSPDNESLQDTVDSILFTMRKYDDYWRTMTKKMAESSLVGRHYNNLAWLTLFSYGNIEQGIEYALKAVKLGKNRDATNHMHTLATLYADQGNASESYHLLRRILSMRKDAEPDREDWYVIGRLAEHFDLRSIASNAYCRIEKLEYDTPIDTYHLAQKRLKKMKVKRCKSK